MTFLDLITNKHLSVYKLSLLSGVPKTTLHDIASGKSDILLCNGKTLLSLSKILGISIEDLISLEKDVDTSKLPSFLSDSITQLRKAIRTDSSLLDCYYDQLNSDINVAEVEGLISQNMASSLRGRYL